MNRRVWLIGGTSESTQLAIALTHAHIPCIVTVTTESARSLYPIAPTLQVWVGRLNADQMLQFVQNQAVGAILDASHPYAVEISQLAIATATQHQLAYLRYERPEEKGQTEGEGQLGDVEKRIGEEIVFTNFENLLTSDVLKDERVLLTVGYKPLALFQPLHEQAVLFARILPSAVALESALAAGFSPDRLIAMRPPISAALEKALWQQWQISAVVTKLSGAPGGEDVKRSLAAELGVKLVAIARPLVNYPQYTSDIQVALEFCRHFKIDKS